MKDQKTANQLEAIDEQFNWGADVNRAYVEQSPLRLRGLLYLLMLIVIALVAWAYYAKVDEVTRGEARVIPAQQVQIIQSQDPDSFPAASASGLPLAVRLCVSQRHFSLMSRCPILMPRFGLECGSRSVSFTSGLRRR